MRGWVWLLHTRLDDVCLRREGGTGVTESACRDLEVGLASQFGTGSANACTLEDESCDCTTKLHTSPSIDTTYQANDKARTLKIGSGTYDYCVDQDKLSFRSSEDDFTFSYRRARSTLPFAGVGVGKIEDEPIPLRGFELNTGDCKAAATFDTDKLTASCNTALVRAVKFGADESRVFFMRRLTVPAGSTLTIVGDRPATIVAEIIDIQVTITKVAAESLQPAAGNCTSVGKNR